MRKRIAKKLSDKKGFTLIEMIIVIAIIAILIALIAPNLKKFLDTAKQTKADAAAKTFYTASNTYLVEKYTKDEAITGDATWTRDGAGDSKIPQDLMDEYLNANEVKDADEITVTIKKGSVTKVEYVTSDDFTGVYPKEKAPTGDGA